MALYMIKSIPLIKYLLRDYPSPDLGLRDRTPLSYLALLMVSPYCTVTTVVVVFDPVLLLVNMAISLRSVHPKMES